MCEDCKRLPGGMAGPVPIDRVKEILKEEGLTPDELENMHEAIERYVETIKGPFEWGPRDKARAIKAIMGLPPSPETDAIKTAWVALYKFEVMAIFARMQNDVAMKMPSLFPAGSSGKVLGFSRPEPREEGTDEDDPLMNTLRQFKTGTDN